MATISDLTPDPKNARKHNERNTGQIERSIQTNGFGRSLLLANDGTIIAGNATFDAAASAGLEDVIVVETDGTKVIAVKRTDVEPGSTRFHELALADNRAAELANWDADVLAQLAEQDQIDLSQFFFDDELDALLASIQEPTAGLTDPDDVPGVPSEPVTKPGDLWLLGRHRLLCGDATVATDVSRLLGGAQPNLMVTDPPYGVEYDPEWRHDAAERGVIGFSAKRLGKVANDDRVDWSAAWSMFAGDVIYCWHASWHIGEVQASLQANGFEMRSLIIWAKDSFSISRGHYHWQHEPCWYAVRKGATASWVGDRSQTTVWKINKNDGQDTGAHGTQKPVECMARPIRNHEGDVYDPFVGSGTTIIASEQLGRTCYAMEVSPAYVDVCVNRWQNFTGQTAVLATDRAMAAA